MKKLVSLLLLAVAVMASAEDVIFRSQKDSINAKIVAVSDEEISYRLADYDEGPMFTLKTKDIVAIRYGNGMKQYFADKVYDKKKENKPVEVKKEEDTEDNGAAFIGATGTIGYTDYFTFGLEPVFGYEVNDWFAFGTGIGVVLGSEKRATAVMGIAEPFLRFCPWHNDLVYIDFKLTAGIGFTDYLQMVQVGIRPSLRFRLTPHCELAADIGLFGAQYQYERWKPSFGITASSAGIWCVYRF